MTPFELATPCSVDPRVRRTRQLLQRALFSLLAEKSFETLSVQDITDRATVNRATFYDHFSDKFALFQDIIGENFLATLREHFPQDHPYCPSVLPRLIQAVCAFLLKLPSAEECSGDHQLLDLLTEAKVKALLHQLLAHWLGGTGKYSTPEAVDLAATLASATIYAACATWKKQAKREPAEAYAQTILPWLGKLEERN